MNESNVRAVTATPTGPQDHLTQLHERYVKEHQDEVVRNDRSQRNPKFDPQPPGEMKSRVKGVKVKHKGPVEPDADQLNEANNKDLKNRRIK